MGPRVPFLYYLALLCKTRQKKTNPLRNNNVKLPAALTTTEGYDSNSLILCIYSESAPGGPVVAYFDNIVEYRQDG